MQGETTSTFSYNHLPSSYSMISFLGEPTIQEDDDDLSQKNKLSTSLGVVVPVILSMFSVILFLRVGFVVGQAGLIYGILMFTVAYLVVIITVLSISAIATNGVVKGGGAYYMISRTLGPEFGGSIGVIFFFANVFSSALYILGFVEALVNNFGPAGTHAQFSELKQDYEWKMLYGTCALLVCCAICLLGAGLFAKTSFIIFLAVLIAVASSLVSFFIQKEKLIPPASDNPLSANSSYEYWYTSWSLKTAKENLWGKFGRDYSSDEKKLNPLIVFGVLFNGVTGIMAGVNMSGDLKNPGRAIPFGTLAGCLITFIIYIILVIFTGFTCSRGLLHNNFNYLQPINKVPELVAVGVFAATLSAALSCLIGASRILHAIAKDKLFGVMLQPFTKVYGPNNEPMRAVLLSGLFVQIVLFIGNVNKVAPLVSMFFLLCYGVTNLACFALKVASAPNFRPTFKYFSWQTALFGSLFCFVIMFLIDPLYATASIAAMIIIFVVISLRAPVTPWGDVSQALIYHQVRKYLLRLDIRKDHVKFWRPQVLLLVSNPRSSYYLIDFVNDIKKSGMYMLGHVKADQFSHDSVERQKRDLVSWLSFVDCAEIKSFVEITIAPTIRQGAQNLLMTSGLGSMRANTVVMGFFDDSIPEDKLSLGVIKKNKFFGRRKNQQDVLFHDVLNCLPRLRVSKRLTKELLSYDPYFPARALLIKPLEKEGRNFDQQMNQRDYVGIIKDCITLGKNVCITRNFGQLDKSLVMKGGYVDVWPVSASVVRDGPLGPYDLTFLLILQLSCILHMVPFWESRTTLRVFSVVGENSADEEHNLINLLQELRIPAEVRMIHALEDDTSRTRNASGFSPALNWYRTVNHLIRTHSSEAYVVFTGLPHPPQDDNMVEQFLQELTILSENIPPVMMVYGRSPVVSTSL